MQAIATLFATSNVALFERTARSLRTLPDISLHPEVVTQTEALTILRLRAFDVLLIDAELYTDNALDTVQAASAISPATRLLLIRADWTPQLIVHVLRSGGAGCLPINCRPLDLQRAIRVVAAGDFWAPRSAVATAFRQMRSAPVPDWIDQDNGSRGQLSPREREIVDWMRTGMSNREIARTLGISDMTVKTHAHNIFNKLEISGRLRLFGARPATLPPLPGVP